MQKKKSLSLDATSRISKLKVRLLIDPLNKPMLLLLDTFTVALLMDKYKHENDE